MTQIEMLRNVAAGKEITDEMMAIAAAMVEKRESANRKPTKAVLERREANEKVKESILGILVADEPKTAKVIGEALEISTQKASSLLKQLVDEGKASKTDVKVTGKGTQKGYTLV